MPVLTEFSIGKSSFINDRNKQITENVKEVEAALNISSKNDEAALKKIIGSYRQTVVLPDPKRDRDYYIRYYAEEKYYELHLTTDKSGIELNYNFPILNINLNANYDITPNTGTLLEDTNYTITISPYKLSLYLPGTIVKIIKQIAMGSELKKINNSKIWDPVDNKWVQKSENSVNSFGGGKSSAYTPTSRTILKKVNGVTRTRKVWVKNNVEYVRVKVNGEFKFKKV